MKPKKSTRLCMKRIKSSHTFINSPGIQNGLTLTVSSPCLRTKGHKGKCRYEP